ATLGFSPAHGSVILTVPPGALPQTSLVTLISSITFPAAPSPAAVLTPSNVGINITLSPPIEPVSPVTLQISYLPGDVGTLDASKFILARYDLNENVW